MNLTSQEVSACILNLLQQFLHRPTGILTYAMCVLWQGVSTCESNPCVTFHRPDGTLRAPLFGLQGGGVLVSSNGAANFESCNIHDNAAPSVCLHL